MRLEPMENIAQDNTLRLLTPSSPDQAAAEAMELQQRATKGGAATQQAAL